MNGFCNCIFMARVDCLFLTDHHPNCQYYQKELEIKTKEYIENLIKIIEQNKSKITIDENQEQILKKSKFLIGQI